ncbi:hypothetical protein BpHYR1_008291 [Brachionus plicatilis]|uniref:Uncharacterized protein n=1 Tax=Brachionus plicatilis TaxID=10195 RepID=A0A3M7RYZ5_BRAPC|nr:hypothetical protein BpHYR1_008291 [Brachionus plicatilis]
MRFYYCGIRFDVLEHRQEIKIKIICCMRVMSKTYTHQDCEKTTPGRPSEELESKIYSKLELIIFICRVDYIYMNSVNG